MVSVCSDGTMWQMNVKSGKQHPVFQAHAKNINDVKFSTDGSVFATVSDDGTLVRQTNKEQSLTLVFLMNVDLDDVIRCLAVLHCFATHHERNQCTSSRRTVHLASMYADQTPNPDGPACTFKGHLGNWWCRTNLQAVVATNRTSGKCTMHSR